MSSVLVCYATGEGQTRKVARRVASVLEDRGHDVELIDAEELPADLDLDDYDAVLVGACLDGASYSQSIRHFVEWNQRTLSAGPSGFFQVTMGSGLSIPARQERARVFAEDFFEATGWRPDLLGLFGGALLYSTYGFLTRLRMRWTVGRTTGDTDTSRDYEYTDWDEVERFADGFATFVEREVEDETRESGAAGKERIVSGEDGQTIVVD